MASGIYNVFLTDLMDGSVNLSSGGDTLKCGLLNNSHSFTATDTTWSSISANEVIGTGYTAGGNTLAGQSVSGTTTVAFYANDTQWTSASFTAYHAGLYDVTNTNSLMISIDFGGAQTVASGTFTIQWNASGIITLTSA